MTGGTTLQSKDSTTTTGTTTSSDAAVVARVNRIPPSTAKRSGGGCSDFNATTTGTTTNNPNPNNSNAPPAAKRAKTTMMDWEMEAFAKLDPKTHANRIDSRYKQIAIGKNTVGYDAYTQQVPKHKRNIRSMETPNTPDHTVDIPAKRWQGLVKAWRVALHKYDPLDLQSAHAAIFNATAIPVTSTKPAGVPATTPHSSNSSPEPHRRRSSAPPGASIFSSPGFEDTTPVSVASPSPSLREPHVLTTSPCTLDFDADDSDDDLI